MKNTIAILFFLLFSICGYSQNSFTIRGTVKNKSGNILSNATIVMIDYTKKDSSKTTSDENGNYSFLLTNKTKIRIAVSFIGYDEFFKEIELIHSVDQTIDDINLNPSGKMLSGITIESQKIQIKEDTVSYLVDSTMFRKNDNVETMLKNLPGVQVDKDGTVTAQGKQVTKVKVNGKDFFNGDVTTATRELNADMVDKIQFIDDYGDQAVFTGIKDGDPSKTMNIVLKKDKNKGYFGNVTSGAGTQDRYIGSLSINRFNNNQQISLLSNMNNTNANLFNFGSMGGAMGNMMAGMARSMGIGRGGAGVASSIGSLGNNDGLNTLKSFGLNYRDEWGPRISIYGSYSFSDKGSSTLKTSTQQSLFQDKTTSFVHNSDNYSLVDNHRFSFNIEFKIDSMNFIKFSPNVSYNKTNVTYLDTFKTNIDSYKISDGIMNDLSEANSPNLSGTLLFNHRFKKKGRSISLNVNGGKSATNSDEAYDNYTNIFLPNVPTKDSILLQRILQENSSKNYGGKLSYTEPLTKTRNLEFNYSYNYQYIGNDRKNYRIDTLTKTETYDESLSNIYNSTYQTNRFGLNLRTTKKKYNYTVGLSAQPATIETKSITGKTQFKNNLINYYPVIRFAYNFSKSRSLNINYNGNTSQPSNAQLQPVLDNSNPQFISIGNPNLKPEFTNTFSMRYNNFDMISGNVFFGNISASFTQDKIVNSTKLLRGGAQETRYENTNGYYTFFGFYNISKPIQNRKYVFNAGGNIAYNNNISFLRDSFDINQKNTGTNWVIGQRFSTDIKIKKWLETTIAINYSINSNKNSLQSDLNSNTQAWTLSNNARIFLKHDFIFSYDVDKTLNSGLSSNVNANPLIITTTLEKQLLASKNLSIKLQGLDLLNQNIGINRTINSSGYTDTKTNRLGRYFLLTIVYRLNKFKGQQKDQMSSMGMPGGGGDMRMMHRMGF